MIRILHIIDFLSAGGAARAMAAASRYVQNHGDYHHQVLGIRGADQAGLDMAESYGMQYVSATNPEEIDRWIEHADIVQIEWWNGAFLNEFLYRTLPACRLISWPHIAGDVDPQFIPAELVDLSDMVLASSPVCFACPTLKELSGPERSQKVRLVYDCADFARVQGVVPVAHEGFNVGYIGTLHPCKMHADYIAMSACIDIPDVYFTLCGGDDVTWLRNTADIAGVADRFQFKGYVSDIKSEISKFDVYGYPLCEDTYASAELNLQEVMYSGVPPVVFPYGGIRQLVFHDYSGLIVHSAREYADAIEYLYHNPDERIRLGRNAKNYAEQVFGAENAARKFHSIYHDVMKCDKEVRRWGEPRGARIRETRPRLTDLWGPDSPIIGAIRFIESLHSEELRNLFLLNMYGEDLELQKQAVTAIGNLSSLMGSCIEQYGQRYPADPFLNLWQGVAKEKLGSAEEALFFFNKAVEHGFFRSYIWLNISCAARKVGAISLAEHADKQYALRTGASDSHQIRTQELSC
jgi:glycosyltransferase involved in cell wall biosynthesis